MENLIVAKGFRIHIANGNLMFAKGFRPPIAMGNLMVLKRFRLLQYEIWWLQKVSGYALQLLIYNIFKLLRVLIGNLVIL